MNNLTHNLLLIIGSPFSDSDHELKKLDIESLYHFSMKNRMPLLYLKSISELGIIDKYQDEYLNLNDQWTKIEGRIKKVVEILDREKIDYTTFKSIKPYHEKTADIDLLIMDMYESAVNVFKKSGYKLLERGPLSSTFRDQMIKIDYDVYDEVGVSHIIYFDKEKVRDNIIEKPLLTGGSIKSLPPATDLLAIVAHSVIKEQMYILGEYYSTLFYLEEMTNKEIDTFVELSERHCLKTAVKTHLGITYKIHKHVHGQVPLPIERIISKLGYDEFEVQRIKKSEYKMPHKIHPITLMKALRELFTQQKTRRSVAKQIMNMMKPSFTVKFIPKALSHVVRETY